MTRALSTIRLTSYCGVYIWQIQSAGICIAVGLKCVLCFNTAVECLKVCKPVSYSPAHVTLCPCGPVQPQSNTFFRQFGLNTLKALCVPVMSNQVLNQTSQWQVSRETEGSYKLMMMSSCWWTVTARQHARQLILPHWGRRGYGSRLPYWTMCFTHCPPSVCHSLLHCLFLISFLSFFPFSNNMFFIFILSTWITTHVKSLSSIPFLLPPFLYQPAFQLHLFSFIRLSIFHLSFFLSFSSLHN